MVVVLPRQLCWPLPLRKPFLIRQCTPANPPQIHWDLQNVKEPLWVTMSPTPSPKAEEVMAPAPLGWMEIHSSRPVGPLGLVPHDLGTEQHHHHNHSHSSHKRAQAQVEKNQQADSDPDNSIAIATREPSATDKRPPIHPCRDQPVCVWDRLPRMVEGIPLEEAGGQDPLLVMGFSLVFTCLLRAPLSASTYIDMVASSLSLMCLDPSSMAANDHHVPVLEDTTDSDWWPGPSHRNYLLPLWKHSPLDIPAQYVHTFFLFVFIHVNCSLYMID